MTRACSAAALAAAVILCACSNLPEVAAGACGNGVVEAGEECDGDASAAGGTCGADGANACHFVCGADGAAPTCPTGYGCAADGRCRAPSATFYAGPGPYPFDATDLAAGDVDGDGAADLVGVNAAALTVRFGDPAADLFDGASQPIHAPTGAPVFGDLDGDHHLDVLVPDSGGIFAFLAAGRTFNPFPYTSIQLTDKTSPVDLADVTVDGSSPLSQVLTLQGRVMIYIGASDVYATCIEGGTPPLCALGTHDVGDLVDPVIPLGRTGWKFTAFDPADDTAEFVLAYKAADHVDLFSPTAPTKLPSGGYDLTSASVAKIETVQLPKAGTLGTQVRVADTGVVAFGQFDDDGCTDLLIPTRRLEGTDRYEGLAIAYGARDLSGCTGKLEPTATYVAEVLLDNNVATKGLIPRVVADLDGDGLSDVVTSELIMVTTCTRQRLKCTGGASAAWAMSFRGLTPREWHQAIATDLNHDGKIDLAGRHDGLDDVDVLLGAGFALFNKFDVTTTEPPLALRTGDFDGDLVLDLAIVAGDTAAGTSEDDQVLVVFGATSGGPGAPVVMGSFGVVRAVDPAMVFTDLQDLDAITDLIVIADRAGARGVAPLIGSSTRRLLAPYLLTEGTDTAPKGDRPVAIQLGDFDGNGGQDVIAMAQLESTAPGTQTGIPDPISSEFPRIFLLSGTGGGNLVGGQPIIPDQAPPNFEYRDAVWTTGRLTPGATLDAVVGVDATDDKRAQVSAASPYVFIASPRASGPWDLATPVALPAPYASMRVHAAQMVDLDGDGADDLVVELVSTALPLPSSTAETAAFVAWNHAGTLAVTTPTAIFPTDQTCHGAKPIQADVDAALEIAAVCTDAKGVTALTLFDWDGAAWKGTATLAVSGSDPRVAVGDFDGDTVDDVAIVTGAGTSSNVLVYVQCPRADVACAAKAASPRSGM